MPSHEVRYFDLPGRGEAIRILLHAAGVDFKDTRIPFSQWPEIKLKTPLGQVPTVNIEGTDYCQSVALTIYAARLAGWYPEDPLEALKCDEIADCLSELTSSRPKVSLKHVSFANHFQCGKSRVHET